MSSFTDRWSAGSLRERSDSDRSSSRKGNCLVTLALGVDIGGTKVAIGVVDSSGRILDGTRLPIDADDANASLEAIAEQIVNLRSRHTVSSIGVCTPGHLDAQRSRIVFAANLRWVDVPVRDFIQSRTDLPTLLEGDANAAAWAEHRFGAGRDEPHLVMVTVGTGLGGGVIDDGVIRHGATGASSDIGHMQVVPDGIECECGGRGCLERYASGQALLGAARTLCIQDPARAGGLLSLGDGTPEGLRGSHVTLAARHGDPLAAEALQGLADWLGRGLAIVTAVLDPGCFVVGGGVSDAGELLLSPVRSAYTRHLPAAGSRSPAKVRLATLGVDAGMVGAADLSRNR